MNWPYALENSPFWGGVFLTQGVLYLTLAILYFGTKANPACK